MGWVVLRPLGPKLAQIPGDLGDARFNNYVLEHFFQWLTGHVESYWDAPFFYPFQQVTAFSDNLLGSVIFYVPWRALGLDRETSFQFWIIIGYALNYLAAAWVLRKMNLKPVAAGLGAFFFAFGLPVLAKEGHAQLLYRFCIPLASFALISYDAKPRLRTLVLLFALVVWQFLVSIYLGVFLTMLLIFLLVALVVLPRQGAAKKDSLWQRITRMPREFTGAWRRAKMVERVLFVLATGGLALALGLLFLPYLKVTREYDFGWSTDIIYLMLPRPRSYLLADDAAVWGRLSETILGVPMRHEHQLFPGVAVCLLALIGVLGNKRFKARAGVWPHFVAMLLLGAFTLLFRGESFYTLVWKLPGFNAIRAVSRVILVLMWPLSVFIAWVASGLVQKKSCVGQAVLYLLLALLIAESGLFQHGTFAKAETQSRVAELRAKLPEALPADPVLYVRWNGQRTALVTEIDSMLLAQELGWPTVNGYSGNLPPKYGPPDSCSRLPARITSVMAHSGITAESYYLDLMDRMVLIGFEDCDPAWWDELPQ
jgi:hypothetical protein